MARIAVGIEYDGSSFSGWQLQTAVPSVQHTLQTALTTVCNHSVELVAAGRTDAGVHSRGQVAHFESDASRTERALLMGANSNLPAGVSLRWARYVPGHFHARYSATARTYRYCILNRAVRSALAGGRSAWVYRPLQVEPMIEAARSLIGTHDFSSFRAAECQARSPVRELAALQVRRVGDFIVLEVTANAFLHHMVRNIAGMLIHVGRGDAPPQLAAELLAARDRRLAPATAPAEGLYFWHVHYPPVFGLPDESDIMRSPAGCPADLLG